MRITRSNDARYHSANVRIYRFFRSRSRQMIGSCHIKHSAYITKAQNNPQKPRERKEKK